jgi:hypothetical protein
MLPGFRFLFAAIVLSLSMLVFGLGAAALLRAAHEQFASTPAWRAAPEATFAQQADAPRDVTRDVTRDAPRPVLAMLRVEPEPRSSDSVPAVNVAAPAEPAATASPPAEPERIAALKPQQETSAPEAARPDPAVESPQQAEAAAAPTDAPAVTDTAGTTPPAAETKIASTEQPSPPQVLSPQVDVAPVISGPAASEPDNAPAATAVDVASTRIATLGGPPVAIETSPPVKTAVSAKPDQDAIRKHRQARRAAHRRRLAARARAAARLAAQQAADPFSQPTQSQPYAQPAAAARSR